MLLNIVNIIIAISAAVVVILVMMQGGRNDGFASAFSGKDSLALFSTSKDRGSDKTLTKLTLVFGIIFFACEILVRFVN